VILGVVGAGTMGAGIAQIAALGGYETRLHDPVPAALAHGVERLRTALTKGAQKGRWSESEAEAAADRIGAACHLADLGECDLVVEAAPEDLKLKRELFAALAAACNPGAILATNTSSLPVTAIAAGVPQPERVVGMHFFNPPALMKLVEVVATEQSNAAALAATTEAGRRMGRTPIRAKDSPGFIANRLARPFGLESLRMLAEGVADAATIDRVVRIGGGFLLFLVAVALLAPLIAPHDPIDQDLLMQYLPPIWAEKGEAGFIFGTDNLGRDILSRLIYGARIALIVAVCAALALYGDIALWTLHTGLLSYGFIGLLLAAEFIVRSWRFSRNAGGIVDRVLRRNRPEVRRSG